MEFMFAFSITAGELLFPKMNVSQTSCASFNIWQSAAFTEGRLVILDTYNNDSSVISSVVDFTYIPGIYSRDVPLVVQIQVDVGLVSRVLSVHGSDNLLYIANFALENSACSSKFYRPTMHQLIVYPSVTLFAKYIIYIS